MTAAPRRRGRWHRGFAVLLLAGLVVGCEEGARPAPPDAARPAAAPPPAASLEDAVSSAADKVFADAMSPASGLPPAPRYALLIDPLVDGLSGVQSTATRSIRTQIVALLRERYPQFEVQRFSAANLSRSPLVLIGTLTAVDADGDPGGERQFYRVWLTLLDLKSGKVVAKARTRAPPDGVDLSPVPSFRDSPTWASDPATQAYIDACQRSKVGDPINPEYLDRLLAAALISDAIEAYDAGRYQEALDLYLGARDLPGGDQLRVHNGIYLANWKLGRRAAAMNAFGDIVDFGLRARELSVKFLFKPGSTAFWPDPGVSGPYSSWLEQIAARTLHSGACLEIVGHSSRTGPEPLNERLSLLRAEHIKRLLQTKAPVLGDRMIADGVGSRETLVGTGTDDQADALDRRVAFKVLAC
jgi:outer membrane protein OmpA-like peptidoglycan-associated protein